MWEWIGIILCIAIIGFGVTKLPEIVRALRIGLDELVHTSGLNPIGAREIVTTGEVIIVVFTLWVAYFASLGA
ncbi:MAG: twin-arginine translocase TatA/TatE family subunit [Vicinamibacterales bacterium]